MSFTRKTNRLPHKPLYQGNYWYFVTICTSKRRNLFVESATPPTLGNFNLNKIGKIVEKTWLEIPNYYKNTTLDEFVVMPNHIHLIIGFDGEPLNNRGQSVDLPQIISAFKRITINKVKEYIKNQNFITNPNYNVGGVADSTNVFDEFNSFWQKSFFDHIIRNQEDLQRIREYIQNNPCNWNEDELNPKSGNSLS